MRAFCTLLIAAVVTGSAQTRGAEAELVNGVQAVVHDSIVTYGEVQIMTMPAEQMLYRQYRSQPEVFYKKLSDARNDSLGQLLEPVVRVGHAGLSEAFLASLNKALDDHELVKVKFSDFKDQKKELAPKLAELTGSYLVMRVGNVAVLYRQQTDPARQKIKFD